jgi:hypothetical protein
VAASALGFGLSLPARIDGKFTFPCQHSGMATAATIPPASTQAFSNTIIWWTGEQVREHLAHCRDPEAALHRLGDEVAAGRAQAKASSTRDPRNGGRPQVLAQPPEIDNDLWWRIMDLSPAIDIWSAPVLSLPRTGNEKAVELVGLRFREEDVRRVADEHGFEPPAPLKPKNRGGISCRAHGVVVAKLTLKLLARDREQVLGLTGVNLSKEVQQLYRTIDPRGLSDQNAGRVANGVLEVLHAHHQRGSEHSIHD